MRVLLFDDSPLIREAVDDLIRRTLEGARITSAQSFTDAAEQLADARPDMVVINISGWTPDDLARIGRLVADVRPSPVVVLDSKAYAARAHAVMSVGCRGYIPLTVAGNLIAAALSVVAAGGEYCPTFTDSVGIAAPEMDRLSIRQRDVVKRLAEGKTNQEIAWDLGIAVPTVKLHVHAILSAIGMRNRTEAALWARSAAGITDA